MKVQVLGHGCAKCQKTEANVREAIAELGVDAEVVKVTELQDILALDVLMTPAVAVDGVVKISGKIPSVDKVKSFLRS